MYQIQGSSSHLSPRKKNLNKSHPFVRNFLGWNKPQVYQPQDRDGDSVSASGFRRKRRACHLSFYPQQFMLIIYWGEAHISLAKNVKYQKGRQSDCGVSFGNP